MRDAVGLADVIVPTYTVDRTGTRHRAWVRQRLGILWAPARVRVVAEAAIREALASRDNPADVINVRCRR